MHTRKALRWIPLVALLGVALILGGAAAALPSGGFWHSDEGAKFLQLQNLRWGADGLETVIAYPGRDLDPALAWVPFHPKQRRVDAGGNLYLQWPIFLPLLAWPLWALAGAAGLYGWPWVGAVVACWGSYRVARLAGAPPTWAAAAIPLVGLATPLGFYSAVFFEHTLAAALVVGAVVALLRGLLTQRGRPLAAAGVLLGLAIYLRSELYLLVPVFGGMVAWAGGRELRTAAQGPLRATTLRRGARVAAWGVGGLLLPLLPLWIFYGQGEGTPLPQHATWYFEPSDAPDSSAPGRLRLPELRYLGRAGLAVIPDTLVGPPAADSPALPWPVPTATVVGCALLAVAALVPPARRALPTGAGLAAIAGAAGAVLLDPQPYHNLHGFLLAAPVVACAAIRPPGPLTPTHRRLAALTAAYCLLHILVISALSGLGPISRYEWGQRYLLPAYPLLIALAVCNGAAWLGVRGQGSGVRSTVANRQSAVGTHHVLRFTFYVLRFTIPVLLILIGMGFAGRGWGVLRAERAQAAVWGAAVAAVPDRVLLTDSWWLPLRLAPTFVGHTWLLAVPPAQAAAWPAQARHAGLPGFSTVTLGAPSVLPGATLGSATLVDGLTVRSYTVPR